MSTGTLTRPSDANGAPLMIALLAVAIGVAIVAFSVYTAAALAGLLLFAFFVRYPVVGLYSTVLILILQGSWGVLSVLEEGMFAITPAQLIGVAALGAWLTSVVINKAPMRFNGAIYLLGGFMVWSFIGVFTSVDWGLELPHWVRMATRFALFILAVNTLTTSRRLHWYLVIIMLCGLGMSVSAVAQYFLPNLQVATKDAIGGIIGGVGDDAAYVDRESLRGEAAIRVAGLAGHSNWLALFVLLVLPLSTYWYAMTKHTSVRVLIGFLVAFQVVALILTFTRTGLVVGLVLAFLLMSRKAVLVSPLRVFAGLFAMVFAFTVLPEAYKERVLNPRQYTQSKSVMSRIALQESATRYALENPLLGLGPGGFGIEFIKEGSETAGMMRYQVYQGGWQAVFVGTHNMYLQLAADHGLVGLGLFMAFFILMMRDLLRKERRLQAEGDTRGVAIATSLIVSLIGFMLCAVFLHALHQEIWWMVAAAAVALSLHDLKFTPEAWKAEPRG
ncbi:MAG: hypothetical protein RLZZ303_2742 [Candidatus Hydrogenedentota bacterium]|jgi:hypothetical protein